MTDRALAPKHDGADVLAELRTLNREPFRRVLQDLLAAKPDVASLTKFAAKSPDRWAQSVAIMGRLGGYSEKTEEGDPGAIRTNMSTSEIMRRLAVLEKEMGDHQRLTDAGDGPQVIDVTPGVVEDAPASGDEVEE